MTNGYAWRARPSARHEWGAFTFNPSLLKLDLWRSIGGYSKHGSEKHINEVLLRQGLMTAYLLPGVCFHIGAGRHIEDVHRRRTTFGERLAKLRRQAAIGLGFR